MTIIWLEEHVYISIHVCSYVHVHIPIQRNIVWGGVLHKIIYFRTLVYCHQIWYKVSPLEIRAGRHTEQIHYQKGERSSMREGNKTYNEIIPTWASGEKTTRWGAQLWWWVVQNRTSQPEHSRKEGRKENLEPEKRNGTVLEDNVVSQTTNWVFSQRKTRN